MHSSLATDFVPERLLLYTRAQNGGAGGHHCVGLGCWEESPRRPSDAWLEQMHNLRATKLRIIWSIPKKKHFEGVQKKEPDVYPQEDTVWSTRRESGVKMARGSCMKRTTSGLLAPLQVYLLRIDPKVVSLNSLRLSVSPTPCQLV